MARTRTSGFRSLADDLRSRSDEQLAALLVSRPDLARPAPSDLTTLAGRASTRASVQRALEGLDLPHLQVAEAVVALGVVTVEAVAQAEGLSRKAAGTLLDDLWDRALLWRSPDGLRPVRTLLEIITAPAGLGPASTSLPDVTAPAVTEAVTATTPAERALLEALAWGPPEAVLPRDDAHGLATAAAALLDRGLLDRTSPTHVVLPREVGLALREGRVHRSVDLAPPTPASAAVDLGLVDADCGGAAADLLALVDTLVETWGARAPRVLRGGGLAVRDLGLLATALDVERPVAALVAELCVAAGLVAADDSLDPAWIPTTAHDEWRGQEAGERWAALAGTWLATTRAPSLVGSKDGTSTINALGEQAVWAPGRALRHDALAELDALPPGWPATEPELEALLRWRRPLRRVREDGRVASGSLEVVLDEARLLGVTGRGALGSAARLLLRGDTEAAAAQMETHLPPAVDHVFLQADLTAVAPGRLDGPVHGLLRQVADIESRGGATVHRFSEASVRRALDAGWSADDLLTRLAEVSRSPVPQPLQYLVTDAARRHGTTRVGSASAYVRSDDTVALERMLADPALGLLGLRRLAPTVLVATLGSAHVLDLLREHGYSPAGEGADGVVVPTRETALRIARPSPAPPVSVTRVDDGAASALVAQMRRGEVAVRAREDDRASGVPDLASVDPTVALALVREAIADRMPLWIGHTDASGTVRRMLVRPTRVEAGRVHGTLDGQAEERSWSVHRITGAAPA